MTKNVIQVFGGKQTRPFIHISDMVDIYIFFLKSKKKPGIYNASYGNLSALKTAKEIKKIFKKCKINIKKSNDPRSYRLSSQKLVRAGFKFKVSLREGINELKKYFEVGKIKNTKSAYSINWIKSKK